VAGGVGGVLAELLFEIADALLKHGNALVMLLKDDEQGRLDSGRDLVPQFHRDGWLLLHAAGIGLGWRSVNFDP
jgi:hypothetical protein